VAFAGVELHVDDGEQRGSPGVHPGQRHQIDEKPYAKLGYGSVIGCRADCSHGERLADQLDDGAKRRLDVGARPAEFDRIDDLLRHSDTQRFGFVRRPLERVVKFTRDGQDADLPRAPVR
jgi:hypothetical protein